MLEDCCKDYLYERIYIKENIIWIRVEFKTLLNFETYFQSSLSYSYENKITMYNYVYTALSALEEGRIKLK